MFRAPYGVWPPAVFSYCAQAGLTPLAWSVDPRDWSRPGAARSSATSCPTPAPARSSWSTTAAETGPRPWTALKTWLPRLLDKGYLFTTPLATTVRPRPGTGQGRRARVVSAIQPHPISKP